MDILLQADAPACPFWRARQPSPFQIRCEGVCGHSDAALIFDSKRIRNDYFQVMCCANFRLCKIYAGICLARYESRQESP